MTGEVIPLHAGGARHAEISVRQRLERTYFTQRPRIVRYLAIRLGSTGAAEDAAQIAFLRLWQRADQVTDSNLAGLLIVTARNVANDILRSRRRESCFNADMAFVEQTGAIDDQNPGTDRVIIARQQIALIRKFLNELPIKCRMAFVAYRFDGDEYSEIANRLGVTESMVRKYVIRAAAHCAARLEQIEGWE